MGFFSDLWDDIQDIGQSLIDIVVDPIEAVIGVVVDWVIGDELDDMRDQQQDMVDQYQGTLVNKQSNIAQIPIIYGQRKVGGTRVFVATSGTDNKYLYVVLVLCEGEVSSIGDVYINDIISTDSQFSGLVTINKYLGSDGQAADSMLTGAGVGWSSAHKLSGLAYLAMRFEWDNDVFGGIPTVHAVVNGRKVYDPRTSTTVYSNNPALCWRDYMTNSRYGKGLPTTAIDDTSVTTAANKCDALVTPYSGGSQQKLFECNAVINTERTNMVNAKVLLSGMRGLMPFSEGKYSIIVEDEKTGSTAFDFDESHIIGSLQINSEKASNKFNQAIVTYINPSNNWQVDQVEWPVTGSADHVTYLSEDNNIDLVTNVDLATVTNVYTAQDLAKLIVKRSRNALLISFTTTSEGLNLSVGDIVSVTHSGPAWTAKEFRVNSITLNVDGSVAFRCVEHQDSIYPWSEKTEADDIPDTNLPNPFIVQPCGVPTVTESLYTTKQGTGVKAQVELSWAAANDSFVTQYEVQYKKNGETKWHHAGTPTDTDVDILDISPDRYYFRVRAINSIGSKSAWATTPATEVFGLAAKPSALTNFAAQNVSSLTILTWEQSPDLDVRIGGHIEVRHSSLTSGAGWSDSISVGNSKLNGTATVAVLPFQAGTYLIRATDSSGIQSDVSSIVALGDTVQAFSSVGVVQAHPLFNGTHDDTVVVDSLLRLQGQNDVDSYGQIDDIALWDVGDGGIDTGGTYTFASGIDAGVTKRQQLTRHVKSIVVQPLDKIDSRSANIDGWSDFDGTGTANGDCKVFVRHTDDDPSGTPTWSAWELLNVNEYNKRAFQFKAELSVDDPSYNIRVSELKVTAQEIA